MECSHCPETHELHVVFIRDNPVPAIMCTDCKLDGQAIGQIAVDPAE